VQIDLDGRWGIGGKIHGGYLLRWLASAAVTDEHPHPLAVSAHFLRAPDPGTADLKVDVLRSGRRVSQSRASLSQADLCVEALVTTGQLDPEAEPLWTASAPPTLPAREDCVRMIPEPPGFGEGFRVGHLDFVDLRCDPETVGFATGKRVTPGRIAGWAAMTAQGAVDPVLDLLVLADALPPVTFDLGVPGWVPTLELTVLVRAVPAQGPLVLEQRAHLLEDGWLDEQCDIWDSRGRLVCQARQLAGYRTPG
jgi:hypothetical protein